MTDDKDNNNEEIVGLFRENYEYEGKMFAKAIEDAAKSIIKLRIYCEPEKEKAAVEILFSEFNLSRIQQEEIYRDKNTKIVALTIFVKDEAMAQKIANTLYQNKIVPEGRKRIWMLIP